jgi:ribosomal protein S18 acetylase RimI-like enzyme
MTELIEFVFNKYAGKSFQIQVLGSNLSAIKLYKKLAFETNIVVTSKGIYEAKLMPDDTKLNMIKHGTIRNL